MTNKVKPTLSLSNYPGVSLGAISIPRPTATTHSSSCPRVVPRPHAASGVLMGSRNLPSTSKGPCDVWGCTPHLWIPVVAALGYVPTRIWFKEGVPSNVVEGLTSGHQFASCSLPGSRRPAPSTPDGLVFADHPSLPPANSRFWDASRAVFVVFASEEVACPTGWALRCVSLAHRQVGGATDARGR